MKIELKIQGGNKIIEKNGKKYKISTRGNKIRIELME